MPPPPNPSWTLGPNRRFPNPGNPHPGWLPRVQLIDTEPGEFWIPALQAELETAIILQPRPPVYSWRSSTANFSYNLRWTPFNLRLIVRWLGNFSDAFEFKPFHMVQTIMRSTITTPAGNYAINGTLNFQWGPL